MKTTEERAVDIDDLPPTPKAIDSICFVCGVTSKELEDAIVSIVKRHEKEIRAEQDKITSHACAKSINHICCKEKDLIHAEIMNTGAI